MSLFQKSVEKKYLNELDPALIDQKYKLFSDYFQNPSIQENIRNSKEEQFQEGFLRELFVTIFGYTLNPQPNFNLTTELKNIANNKKADGAILTRGHATRGHATRGHATRGHATRGHATRGHAPLSQQYPIAVIELKGTDTTDLDKIEAQAFGYKNHHPKCVYVITSNFEKLRFYIQNAVDFIDFDLFNLTREQFSLMWLCLAKDNLLNGLPYTIKESSLLQEENITKKLYADYSNFREVIYSNLVKNNSQTDNLTLFKKTQKLLDRFLFVFFAEDRLLLPANSISDIIKKWQTLKDIDAYIPLYIRFKQFFGYLDKGYKGKDIEIFAYNGGLFAPDEILDNISVDDDILYKHTLILSQYDYETDVDVNILGHIFEHSLGEIAAIAATGGHAHQSKLPAVSIRKKDGIYYTPKYITKYIVENTLGKLCKEKRIELDIIDEEYAKGRKNRKKDIIKALDDKLTEYRNWLLNLTILDPACGSGAFLNQALDFLINEHRKIDELRAKLLEDGIVFPDITTDILEKNIYGVDINEESVEIAKLSLWLRTAQKGRKLSSLSNNIKCGNSLIDDPAIAGEKAFNWKKEFPNIFQAKEKKAWHVTTAIHNSRYSQRMFDKHVVLGEAEWLDAEDEIIITQVVRDIAIADKLNIIEYNICGDHIHLLLVCEETEVSKIVGKIKSITSKERNRKRGYTTAAGTSLETRGHAPMVSSSAGTSTATRGHAPLSEREGTRGITQWQLWTQKFGKSEIKDEQYLRNAIEYIRNNRKKHELPEVNEIEKLKKEFLCSVEHAFRNEYNGGFDVVIGNPPYFSLSTFEKSVMNALKKKYINAENNGDIYCLFFELGIELIKHKGLLSFITSNQWLQAQYGKILRNYFIEHSNPIQLINFGGFRVFSDATVDSSIITISKDECSNKLKACHFSNDFNKNNDLEIYIDKYNIILDNLRADRWLIIDKNKSKLRTKIFNGNNKLKEHNIDILRGVLTGFNEAFIISNEQKEELCIDNPENYEIIKPLLRGRDIHSYYINWDSLWLITTLPSMNLNIDNYPKVKKHLLSFGTRLEQTGKKGSRKKTNNKWFETQDIITYYKKFYSPKILYPETTVRRSEFYLDNENFFIDKTAFFITGENLNYYQAILASKLMEWYLEAELRSLGKNSIQYSKIFIENTPIPFPTEKYIVEFKNKTELISENYKLINQKKSKLISLLESNYQIENIQKKFNSIDEYDFKTFIETLSKQKIKLSISQQAEWKDYFDDYKKEISELQFVIKNMDREIDLMVYELYGLTEEEIKIVEG